MATSIVLMQEFVDCPWASRKERVVRIRHHVRSLPVQQRKEWNIHKYGRDCGRRSGGEREEEGVTLDEGF